MLITNNNTNSSITYWLLLCCVLFVSSMLMTINTTLACTLSSSCGSLVSGNSTNSTSVQAHWEVLDREISELTCQQNRLTNVLSLLKINSTLNNEIISIRSKHLEKITKAITLLTQESSFIKLAWEAARNISLVLRNGQTYEYLDGSRAKSCREYKNPIHPYKYHNQGSGLYNIEPSSGGDILTVYCDMTTDGGGWTLISGVRNDYGGIHFHTFEDLTASASSTFTSFHLKTAALLLISTQVRAAADTSGNPITTFYQSTWGFSAYCTITTALRNAIRLTPTNDNGDIPANCVILSGGTYTTPSHYTYGRTSNGHSVGFRMGVPFGGYPGHMTLPSYATYSWAGAPEGGTSHSNLGTYNLGGGEGQRNGAIFLR